MSVKTAPRVSLGKNGPLVSRMGLGLGLGTMGLTRPTYGAIPIQGEIFAFLDHAYEAGVTFWDSADYYNDCEEIIGKWFRPYLHIPNPETPIEETMRALKELQEAAKIAPVAAIQIGYSAFGLYCEGEKGTHILDTCRELDLAIVAAMPLGRGLLTANFIDGTASGQQDSDVRYQLIPRFTGGNREKNI
uniref:NADP-dependent oxidoreductase domain-containing protein n=1 Tax=Fusarium oxysporum (strain Fo5176) TaxID=660025 RepID=A0A0D2Y8U0_FUSOF